MQDEQAQLENEKKIKEKTPKTNVKDRFKRLGVGFKRRLLKFIIVSLIGLGINLGALALTEFIIGKITTVLDFVYTYWIFEFTIKGLIAIAMGIAAATTSNYILNKLWTFSGSKDERVGTQFIKYALVGASGAVLKYLLTKSVKNYC